MYAALFCLLAVAGAALAADGILYGISAQAAGGVGLVTIDTVTGQVSPDGVLLPFMLEAQNLATPDVGRGIYYTVLYNDSTQAIELIGFNLKGAVVTNVKLPFTSSAFVGVGEAVDVDPANGDVFCVGLMADGQTHQLVRVEPSTGAMKVLNTMPNLLNVLGGAHCFCPATNEVWLQYAVNNSGSISFDFFAYDAVNGSLTKQVPEDSTRIMVTLSFDRTTNMLVGFGVDVSTSPAQRTVMVLDPKTGKFSTTAVLKDFWIDNGGIATINNDDHVLYGQIQAANPNATTPFSLVSVNLTDGTVINAPPLCQQPALCPWSMEYFPASKQASLTPTV